MDKYIRLGACYGTKLPSNITQETMILLRIIVSCITPGQERKRRKENDNNSYKKRKKKRRYLQLKNIDKQ